MEIGFNIRYPSSALLKIRSSLILCMLGLTLIFLMLNLNMISSNVIFSVLMMYKGFAIGGVVGVVVFVVGIVVFVDGIVVFVDGIVVFEDGIVVFEDGIVVFEDGIVVFEVVGLIVFDDGELGHITPLLISDLIKS